LIEVRKRSRDIFDNLRPLWGERELSRRLASRSCSAGHVVTCGEERVTMAQILSSELMGGSEGNSGV
jgi:hypothetical protein